MPCDGDPVPLDCSKLRSAVDDAAGVAGTLWISYVGLLFYMLLAIVGVTHSDQFLQNNVDLPFLQIKLPMLGFLLVGPPIVLLGHAYVLHHMTLLAATARELNKCDPAPSDVDSALLGISLFAQMLAGPARTKNGSAWLVEQIIAWVTLVAIPVLTLMYFELQFLPSHNETTTWLARICLLLDIGLLWWMWPRAICRSAPLRWFKGELAPWGPVFMIPLTVAPAYIAIVMATFPGEWLETTLAAYMTVPGHETFVVGVRETDGDKLLIRPLFPNRLFVRGVEAFDLSKYDSPAKLAMTPVTKSMRDRNLEYAIIMEAQLARVDFTNAHLKGASLVRAHAMGAWFGNADLSGAQLDYAELQGASFFGAHLAGATMDNAQLQGASLAGANLRSAWMQNARLDGASLASADLRRALLDRSWLVGASLPKALLQGASLVETHLEAALLDNAALWRANFSGADGGMGVRHLDTSSEPEPPPCVVPAVDACGPIDVTETLKILETLPHNDSRNVAIKQLLMPPSLDKDSPERLASFGVLDDKDLPKLWQNIACINRGAPFIIAMLINTYEDKKGWTRPTTVEDTVAMVKVLLDKEQCTASLAIPSDAMRMELRDLPLLRRPASTTP